jgi:hypothetical protein
MMVAAGGGGFIRIQPSFLDVEGPDLQFACDYVAESVNWLAKAQTGDFSTKTRDENHTS